MARKAIWCFGRQRIIILLFFLTVSSGKAWSETFVPPQKTIPPTLFGLHIHRLATSTPWPPVNFGSWSLIDAYVNWHNLQPDKKSWSFANLDKYVFDVRGKKVELLLTLAFPPQWASARPSDPGPYGPGTSAEPRSMADWQEYVKMVAERYKGRIGYFQVWDEPNEKTFFTGSQEKLLELIAAAYQILKEESPASQMLSPGFVGPGSFTWFDNFLGSGGAAYADIIGYHFYPPVGGPDKNAQRPEAMIPLAKEVKKIMAKHGLSARPLWNTGIGYWNVNSDGTPESTAGVDERWIRLEQDRAAAWVARTFILSWALGMERVFWYSWDHLNMGLIEPGTKELKPAGKAYQTISNWLVGSTMTYCRNDDGGQWECELKRGTRTAWLVWRITGNVETPMPSRWGAREFRTLLGETIPLQSATQPILVGEQPILIKADNEPW